MDKRALDILVTQLEDLQYLRQRNLLREDILTKIEEKITIDYLRSLDDRMVVTRLAHAKETEMMSTRVFISYAHADNEGADRSKRWLDRLMEHLKPLALEEYISVWSDEVLEIGNDWRRDIRENLSTANVAVLLISPAFLASRFIRDSEIPLLLKNAHENGVQILPIVLRHCLFHETKFKYPDPVSGPHEFSLASLQAANSPDRPLNGMQESEQDRVLLGVAQRVFQIVQAKSFSRKGISSEGSLTNHTDIVSS